MLLNAVLSLPNSHSEILRDGRRVEKQTPSLVRMAEEFLEANAANPVTISDVVAECGCSRRALFNAFRRHRNYTPLQFLTASRLRRARNALLQPSPTDTVSSIATECGFSHLGRFSKAYRELFDENPSKTLSRARGFGSIDPD